MENKWMLTVVFLLAVCLTISLASGQHGKTVNEVTKLEASRNVSAELGRNLTLLCTSSVIDWNEIIYVIWKISSQEKICRISVAPKYPDNNTCNDEKYIRGKNSGVNYSLEIPNFSVKDEGNYTCDVSYPGGGIMETVTVSAWAPSQTSSWWVTKDHNTFAVCEARSIPAASIQWETPWTSPSPSPWNHSSRDSNGYVTVSSWLELPQNYNLKNPTCVVHHLERQAARLTDFKFSALPQTSSRRVTNDHNTFAVCEARSIPAASIQWEMPWTSPSPSPSPWNHSSQDSNGYVTVSSWLELPQNYTLKNPTCVVHHLGQQVAQYKFEDTKPVKWPLILLGVCATCSIVTLLTGLYITRGKLRQLRVFRKICCTSQISQAPREEKAPQPRDPEEVEPYASYVQRVNSIYNSSAELFNA